MSRDKEKHKSGDEVMPTPTSPLHLIHTLFSIPSGQTLSVFLTSFPSPPHIQQLPLQLPAL